MGGKGGSGRSSATSTTSTADSDVEREGRPQRPVPVRFEEKVQGVSWQARVKAPYAARWGGKGEAMLRPGDSSEPDPPRVALVQIQSLVTSSPHRTSTLQRATRCAARRSETPSSNVECPLYGAAPVCSGSKAIWPSAAAAETRLRTMARFSLRIRARPARHRSHQRQRVVAALRG